MLELAIRKYQNRAIEAAQVIEEMIALAKDMRRANERGATLKLSEEELAFYDALETNDSAVQVLGDDTLRTIAREVTDAVRKNVTIDWTMRENVRAQLRVIIKRNPTQVRLSTGQTGEGNANCFGTGGVVGLGSGSMT
jgi:type I restriction enzyme, R subunit